MADTAAWLAKQIEPLVQHDLETKPIGNHVTSLACKALDDIKDPAQLTAVLNQMQSDGQWSLTVPRTVITPNTETGHTSAVVFKPSMAEELTWSNKIGELMCEFE